MKVNNNYIGIFDSGVGGLTALKYLRENLPNEKYYYLGDTKRCPYGVKGKEELEAIVESDIRFLEKRGVKMIIIACNTATANSYHIVSSIPIIRIIEPTCKAVNKIGGKTAILATNYTISSKAYEKFLKVESVGVKCQDWVRIIEEGKTESKEAKDSVKNYLKSIKGKVQNVILGCTHFGLLEKEIREYLGDVNIINSSESILEDVKKTLDEVGYNREKACALINVTGDIDKLNISWLTKEKMDIKKVDIDE